MEHQNNKQKLLILEALPIRNMQPTLNRINFQTSANVIKCLQLVTLIIETHLKANAIIFNGKDVLKVKLATIVEGDPKAPFSIATTPKCRGGHYSFPWISPLYPRYVPYIAEC